MLNSCSDKRIREEISIKADKAINAKPSNLEHIHKDVLLENNGNE